MTNHSKSEKFSMSIKTVIALAFSFIAAFLPIVAQAQESGSANPLDFQKKAYKPDGTPWSGPVNVGDTVKYVLTYDSKGKALSGPVKITDTLSASQTYVAPHDSSSWLDVGCDTLFHGQCGDVFTSRIGSGFGFCKFDRNRRTAAVSRGWRRDFPYSGSPSQQGFWRIPPRNLCISSQG